MKIDSIIPNIVFRSGYPTFNSSGHLSYRPETISNHVNLPYRPIPTGLLIKEGPPKLDYFKKGARN